MLHARRRPRLFHRSPRTIPRALAPFAFLLATGLGAGGCGSSPSGTSASPATVVPAAAPLYIDAVVQPGGSLKTDASTIGRSLTGRSQPYTGLLQLLQGPTGHAPNYEREVKPWLGPEAGIFLSAPQGAATREAGLAAATLLRKILSRTLSEGLPGAEGALTGSEGLPRLLAQSSLQGALVLDTSDVAKASSFLKGQARSAAAHQTSYHGVVLEVAPDGIAEGIVHRFAVIGSEAGVESVIDTAAGGASLAHAAPYSKLVASAEPGRLANAYLDVEALSPSLRAAGGGSPLSLLGGLLGPTGQLYASAIPTSSSLALDFDTLPPATGAASTSPEGTSGAQVFSGLPGSAWLGIGIGDLGKDLGGSASSLSTLTSLASTFKIGPFSLEAALAPLHSRSIDVSRDLLSWMGATGVYVAGSNVLSLQAAVIIASKDPARSRAAVGKLAQAYREAGGQVSTTSIPGADAAITVKLPSFPLALTIADGQGKFVFGLGQASVQEALNPQSTVAGGTLATTAEHALGGGIKPSAAIEVRTLVGLLESLSLNQIPGFSGLFSALRPLDGVAAGSGQTLPGGVKRARVVLSLQAAG